jgi:hypothetical protein
MKTPANKRLQENCPQMVNCMGKHVFVSSIKELNEYYC